MFLSNNYLFLKIMHNMMRMQYTTFLTYAIDIWTTSQNPQERSKDSKKVAEDNIDQEIDNEDPTESVEVTEGGGEVERGAADMASAASGI
jgi:hypothetical protein